MTPNAPRPRGTFCTECGQRVQRAAARCPHCGARLRSVMRPSFLVVAGVVVGLLVLFLLLPTLTGSSRSRPGGREAEEHKPTMEVLQTTQWKLERDVRYWRNMEDGFLDLHRKEPDNIEFESLYADAVKKRTVGERELARVKGRIAEMGGEP